jgi:NTP pyrophosphatase (non-canonical NTP hydrolase)
MKSNENLEKSVIEWAQERNLTGFESRFVQLAKVMEELGELAKAIIEEDKEKIIDSLGDVNVTLIILANQMNFKLSNCLDDAYNEIKDREGILKNGSFIRNK